MEHRGYKFDGDFDKFIYKNSKMYLNLLDEKGEKINLIYDSLVIKSKYKNKTENRKVININIVIDTVFFIIQKFSVILNNFNYKRRLKC